MKRICIIGGGLAGVSAGYHLREHGPRLFESESEIGGLCRSFTSDGFTFDCTGHLIHLRNPYVKELIAELLPDAFDSHERRAAIHSKDVVTPYPFQANTYGLPPEVVKECLLGFIESMNGSAADPSANFHDWTIRTFGTGIAKHFMLPYNEKFWKTDLRGITSDWVSWSIPKPKLEEVVNGALGLTNRGLGYNPRFIYPKSGGIQCLPLAFTRPLEQIRLSTRIRSIDSHRKVLWLDNGEDVHYDFLVTTAPLPATFQMINDAPDHLKAAAAGLRAISVLNINIGVDRPDVDRQHWIYFPENEFIFSRIGFPMNFSAAVAPPGTSSIYIEITHPQDVRLDVEECFEKSIDGLRRAGILREDDRILTRHVIDLKHAYVVFDRHRQQHLQDLIDYLESRDIHTCGRYGKWDYYSMEDSILSGKASADAIAARLTPVTVPAG